jgi:hypothetical protein
MNKRTIYWYRLDEKTGNISVIPIDNYEDGAGVSGRFYRFKKNGSTYYAMKDKFDEVKHWSIYSFDDDEEKAKTKFELFVADKWEQADKEAKRYGRLLFNVMGKGVSK